MRLWWRPAAVRTVQRQRTVLCAVRVGLQPVCVATPSAAGVMVPQSSTDGSIAVDRPGGQAGLSWSSVDPQATAGASCGAERSAVPCAEIRPGSLKDGSSAGPAQICFMPSGRFRVRDRCAWTHEKWSQMESQAAITPIRGLKRGAIGTNPGTTPLASKQNRQQPPESDQLTPQQYFYIGIWDYS